MKKKLFNLPQLLINDELLWPSIGPKAEKRYHQIIWEANLQPLRVNVHLGLPCRFVLGGSGDHLLVDKLVIFFNMAKICRIFLVV